MTISNTVNKYQYLGNGATTGFSFPNVFFDTTDLVVTLTTISTGIDVSPAPVLNGAGTYDYTVTGTFDSDKGEYTAGGTVTFNTAPPSTLRITLERVVPQTQGVTLIDNSKFPANTVNGALDRLTILSQRNAQLIAQSVTIPSTDPAGVTVTIPPAVVRANKVFAFDASGNATASDLPAGGGVGDVVAASNNQMTGNNAFSGNNSFSGTNTHTGTETHSGPESFTGKLKASALVVTSGASFLPQGRLTLATGVSVMVSAQTGKTTVYYTPHNGNVVPIYDGTDVVATVFAELSNDLTASSVNKAGPAAATTNSNYDLFVWNDGGTVRLTRGPLWTSDTARGTGAGTTELQRLNGIWTNKMAITNGPAANQGTYVGTIRTDSSSQANWQPGAVAANGTAALLTVWNAYNRAEVCGLVGDTTNSWAYGTATVRPANNSTTMRVSFVVGLQEDFLTGDYAVNLSNDTADGGGYAGVGYDSTTAFSGRWLLATRVSATSGTGQLTAAGKHSVQALGFHYLQALEEGNGTGTQTWYGDNGGVVQSGLAYVGRF